LELPGVPLDEALHAVLREGRVPVITGGASPAGSV